MVSKGMPQQQVGFASLLKACRQKPSFLLSTSFIWAAMPLEGAAPFRVGLSISNNLIKKVSPRMSRGLHFS